MKKFPGGANTCMLHKLGIFLTGMCPNVVPVGILRRYMLFGLVPEEMGVRVKFLEVLQAEIEPAAQG